jgi:hypothetical protein
MMRAGKGMGKIFVEGNPFPSFRSWRISIMQKYLPARTSCAAIGLSPIKPADFQRVLSQFNAL